jgi:hypothetical protein
VQYGPEIHIKAQKQNKKEMITHMLIDETNWIFNARRIRITIIIIIIIIIIIRNIIYIYIYICAPKPSQAHPGRECPKEST